MSDTRTFSELLEAYRQTAVAQSKQTDPGMILCGGDILDDLADELRRFVIVVNLEPKAQP